MKSIWKLFFLIGIFLLIGITLVSHSIVSSSNCVDSCTVSLEQTTIAAPVLSPTPIGGASNALYIPQYRGQSPNYYQDEVLVNQHDLNDSTSIVPVLRLKQIEEKLGKKLDHVQIASISPDAKMMYMNVYEANNQTPIAYLAAIDLSFLVSIKKGWELYSDQIPVLLESWSPDGTMIMGSPRMGYLESGSTVTSFLRRGTTQIRYVDVRGYYPLSWSRDSSQIYLRDFPDGNHFLIYNVRDGGQQRLKLGFLDKINRENKSQREFVVGLGFSPVSDETLWLTWKSESGDLMTLYKTTSDFTDATILTNFNASLNDTFGYHFFRWSPNGQYVWVESQRFESRIFKVADGSLVWDKDFLQNDKGQWRRFPCGWTPDNHFATREYDDTFSLWDTSAPDKPILSPAYSGVCPLSFLP